MIVNMRLQIMIRSFGKWTFKRLEDFVRRKAHELINELLKYEKDTRSRVYAIINSGSVL